MEGFKAQRVSCGSFHSGVVGEKEGVREVWMWGAGDEGQLGTGMYDTELSPKLVNLSNVETLSCGY